MKLSLSKLRKMANHMEKLRIAPISIYILDCGNKKFGVPVSKTLIPFRITGVSFPVKVFEGYDKIDSPKALEPWQIVEALEGCKDLNSALRLFSQWGKKKNEYRNQIRFI